MRVAAEVAVDLLGAAEGAFGVDHPVLARERGHETVEGFGIFEAFEAREVTLGVRFAEPIENLAAKEGAHNFDREEESLACVDPAATIETQPAACDDAVDMRMEEQLPRPGVQHGGEAELRTETALVAPEFEERLRGAGEEHVEDELPPVARQSMQ